MATHKYNIDSAFLKDRINLISGFLENVYISLGVF